MAGIAKATNEHWQIVLAIDFGRERVGLAVGHRLTGQAQPLATIVARSHADRLAAIALHHAQWSPDLFIVGEPQHADGSEHPVALGARRFARQIAAHFRLPTFMVDETLSSHTATQRLIQAADHLTHRGVDAMAAAVIGETFLAAPEAARRP
jgi:putative holliday junction resolvase